MIAIPPSPQPQDDAQGDAQGRRSQRGVNGVFWRLMTRVALVAGCAHLVFCGLFLAAGAMTMAAANVLSVCLFAASHALLRRRRNTWAVFLIVSEIVLHATVAVLAIGWESGFHYYLVLVPPVIMFSPTRSRPRQLAFAVSICALYLGLDAFARNTSPLDQITPEVQNWLRYFNVSVTFALLIFLAESYYRLVKRAQHQLHQAATTDPLTSLYNRRRITEIYQYERVQRKRECTPLSFVLCDIDHFKRINDQWGHDGGDQVLLAVAKALKDGLREQDSIGRWGGEEFLIVMPHTDVAGAMLAAQRLRERVAAMKMDLGGLEVSIGMTFGVATQGEHEDPGAAIKRADMALYQGKANGRNQVVGEHQLPRTSPPAAFGQTGAMVPPPATRPGHA